MSSFAANPRAMQALRNAYSRPNPRRTLRLSSQMPWGKYKGEIARAVLQHDPAYMQWFIEHADSYTAEPALKTALHTRLEETR